MSREGVVDFIEKVLNDQSFQAQLKTDPEKALSQFDLTDEEKAAVKNGSEEELKSLGLDVRLSKTSFFGLEGGLGGDGGFGGDGGDGIDGPP